MVPRITLLLLLSAVVVAAVAYGIENRVVNAYGRLPSLRFLHVPKTGTSFIISLRNYLDACEVKDKTCSGDHGGSDLTVRFANDTPFYIEACDGQLEACSKSAYHMHWRYTFQGNYVTLLREPGEQAVSGFVYTNALLQAANKTQMAAEEYVRRHHNLHVKVGGEGRGDTPWVFCVVVVAVWMPCALPTSFQQLSVRCRGRGMQSVMHCRVFPSRAGAEARRYNGE